MFIETILNCFVIFGYWVSLFIKIILFGITSERDVWFYSVFTIHYKYGRTTVNVQKQLMDGLLLFKPQDLGRNQQWSELFRNLARTLLPNLAITFSDSETADKPH